MGYGQSLLAGFLLCALALLSAQVPAQAETKLSGYVKNMLLRNDDTLITGNRLRLKYLIDFSEVVKGEFQYTNQFSFGQFPENTTPLNRQNFVDSDRVLLRAQGLDWTQSLYRAFVSFKIENLDLVVGRQRIAWGTGRFWNPTDLLNPFDPTSIEGSERSGVDALNIKVNTDRLSYLSLVAAMGSDLSQTSLATRYHTTIGPNDISLMTGRFRNNLVIGGDFSGSYKGAGLRLESSYTLSPYKNYWKVVLSADYQFPKVYALAEYYYNGQGENLKSKYAYSELLSGNLTSLGQNYLGCSLSYPMSLLLSFSGQLLINLDDGSFFLAPVLSYSVSENTDWAVGLSWYQGVSDTEFGRYSPLLFSQLQWSF